MTRIQDRTTVSIFPRWFSVRNEADYEKTRRELGADIEKIIRPYIEDIEVPYILYVAQNKDGTPKRIRVFEYRSTELIRSKNFD